ncbi:MAG: hypothetical protein KJO54_01835 [Gammaproteobacteria bacterium]|nr:hypothetical protein [Gammaproteobacteria bacterium]NNF61064.1 hypothetical protein [Gammaproteobacteria bacterium]NNM21423.1 hypothetical protein [Gammaproteobacteria bacterium]
MRKLLAIVVAPFGALAAILLVTVVLGAFDADQILPRGSFHELMWFAFTVGVAATVFAYPVMLTLGLLLISYANHRGWKKPMHMARLGAGAGALPFALYFSVILIDVGTSSQHALHAMLEHSGAEAAQWLLYGGAAGALTALCYWWLACPDIADTETYRDSAYTKQLHG